MKQLVHRTVSATSAVAHRTAEACSRWTLKSNAIRGRMNKQRQHGAVDCALQAARKGLHQRSLSVDSLGSFTGL
jgi:3-oxoacyl-[acyl-carrier-protein] synthase III